MPPLRAAILGYGRSGGSMHAGAIEASPDFEMTAVCDIDPARTDLAAKRFSCRAYDNYHEMFEKEKLDLVCVITRSDQHCEMACDCLEAGVNVLVTKPWAVNTAEAERMVAAAAKSPAKLLPWLPARWGSELRRLRELVSGNAIGNVFLVRRAQCSFGTRSDWQTKKRHGGGYLLNWGPHIIDPPLLLLDSPVRSVYARMGQVINPGDAEDCFLALFTLENGATVQAEYTISTLPLPGWFLQADRGSIQIRGKDLTVKSQIPAQPDDPTRTATMQAESGGERTETIAGNPYGDEHEIYKEIAQGLRGEKEYPVRPADALQLSRIFDAVRASAEENRVVQL
ncbi:Gfo/Idh/MocA family oxidoreductase [bacterium]|nr:Gfo/Idh/MocA family oxidoreductase [bacterium]